jgi:ferrochelatase
MKTAVLLINLGSPGKPTIPSVWKFLRQFLMDPRVIDIPFMIRYILVNFIIIPKRVANSTKEYKKLWQLFGASPLISYAEKLTKKLNVKLDDKYHVYFAMRYQNPSIESTLLSIYSKNYEHIIILPLYPQYASASTGSTIECCEKIISKWWRKPKLTIINQFYHNSDFINCIVDNTKKMNYKEYDHILFSYHGLPERHVDKAHPGTSLCANGHCENGMTDENMFCYKAQCYETTKLITAQLSLPKNAYTTTFQSRLDNKWIKPYTDKVMLELSASNHKKVLVLSPAFVSDCLETSIEISERYKNVFIEHGGGKFMLVPSLNDNDNWVDAVAGIINSHG